MPKGASICRSARPRESLTQGTKRSYRSTKALTQALENRNKPTSLPIAYLPQSSNPG